MSMALAACTGSDDTTSDDTTSDATETSVIGEEPVASTQEEAPVGNRSFLPLVDVPPRIDPDPFPPSGVATSFVQLDWFAGIDPSIPMADVRLTGCRARQPGRTTFDFEARSATDGEAILVLSTAASGRDDFVGGVPAIVELDGPGDFSVTTDLHRLAIWNGDLEDFVNGDFGDLDIYADGFENTEVGGCIDAPAEQAEFLDIVQDPVAPDVIAPTGTAEWFAQSASDPDGEYELLPLVHFVEREVLVGFDRIHLAPAHRLHSMTLDYFPMPMVAGADTLDPTPIGTCVRVDSRYRPLGADETSDQLIDVAEWFGCTPGDATTNVALGDPDEEFVTVDGEIGVDALIADLVRAPFDDV
ncbi:MAG: hypothetical protein WA964_07090 [Ilumatobacter sp.]|uniref:hypothetical protein n=1 Tax=Ilumatobacter sp. TaxID=1967498 RepID=UPI003C778CB1